ncbi:VWA domain-containing protein [Streptomyces goshikiensis]|uniref:VWA domain-containing protein n=1 Tax=Streptomyces goshikiensis TaxID=1942 RepID=UPI0033D955F8
MSLFRKSTAVAQPGLINLIKTAAVSLEKSGLAGHRAAVQLVLDHSGSMRQFYRDGSVQRLAEQALGLSVNLDDDGSVPVTYFGSTADAMCEARLDNYDEIIERTHTGSQWGSTNYVAAMRNVIDEHEVSGATAPGFVIFQTDGDPDDQAAAERMLREASRLPIFWAFVGFGPSVRFLEKLDDLGGRQVDNASFFHARDPHRVSDAELYGGLTSQYAGWLTAATAAGIVR